MGSPPHQIDGPVSAVLARRLRLVKLMTMVSSGRVEAGAGGGAETELAKLRARASCRCAGEREILDADEGTCTGGVGE